MEPSPLGFCSVSIFRKELIACDVLYKLKYILWVVALLEPVTSSKMAAILAFTQNENSSKNGGN